MPFDIETTKAFFFDRAAVERAVDNGTRRALSKFGAFVRQRARTSIRKRKATSKPGSPPSSHEGSLRRLILFAYDPGRKSVVIGPALLEYGGTVARTGRDGNMRVLHYRPRPYMNPAFRAELPKAPLMFKDMIR